MFIKCCDCKKEATYFVTSSEYYMALCKKDFQYLRTHEKLITVDEYNLLSILGKRD